jgi:hypothetical protein
MSLVGQTAERLRRRSDVKFMIHNAQFRLNAFAHTVWQHLVICEQKLCQGLFTDSSLIFFNIWDFV